MAIKKAEGSLGMITFLVNNSAFREWMRLKFNTEDGARAERKMFGRSPHAKIFFETVGIGLRQLRLVTHATREEMRAAEKLLKLEHNGDSSNKSRKNSLKV